MIESLKTKGPLIRWLLFGVLLTAFVFINGPFLIPLTLAGIFALGLNDVIISLNKKFKMNHGIWVGLTLLAGLALFWIPLSLAIYRIVMHINEPQTLETDRIIAQIHALKDFVLNGLQKLSHWTGADLATPARGILENILKKTGEIVIAYSSHFLAQLPAILLASFVFMIVLALLLTKASKVKDFTLTYSPFNKEMTETLILVFKKSCSVTLFSTLVVGLIQAGIIGLGSLIFGEGDFWLILTITFFVSFIPVIGAAPMGYLLALLAFLGDRTGPAIGMAVVATVAGSIDNVIKPFMVGGENKISPIVAFTCVVGAIIMLGLPGLLVGPVIMNLFVGISPLLLKER
ncbi:MAG: AI-2E family transporter [Bdellovibrio sp.]|nr:AI-2E family transporter [Bdellovibrio sp.]